MSDARARTVLRLARDLLEDLDFDGVLEDLLAAARELSGARYAALGVLNEERTELSRFLTLGIEPGDAVPIGDPPRGRGVLGELIREPVPMRLADVGSHPRAYGFPPGHPPMRTFLGVPIFVGGEPFGNLYLTDKAGGEEFTQQDEEDVVLFAEFAGVAVDHARRYGRADRRGEELQRVVDALDATVTISRALAGQTELGSVLDLIAKRGRALISARAAAIVLEDGDRLRVAAAAGEVPDDLLGKSIDRDSSVAAVAIRKASTQRLDNEASRARYEEFDLGCHGLAARSGLVVPLMLRARPYGALVAIEPGDGRPDRDGKNQELLEAFAGSAAIGVATARLVDAERQRERVAAGEAERARWSRELHDETLQGLAALRLSLGAVPVAEPEAAREMLARADRDLEEEIEKLQGLIADLRPVVLDRAGLKPALEALAERFRARGADLRLTLDLVDEALPQSPQLDPELKTCVYGVVQEALGNAATHAAASTVKLAVTEAGSELRIVIDDDGDGFDPSATLGLGLRGMKERVDLLRGSIAVDSAPGEGTRIEVALPLEGQPVGDRGVVRRTHG